LSWRTYPEMAGADPKPRLLLHICCAPCSTWVCETLKREYQVTGYFYNPNIQPQEEYEQRRREMHRLADQVGLEVIDDEYEAEAWLAAVRGLEEEPEGGRRCQICYDLRLRRAAEYARDHGLEWLATTLTISPHKQASLINPIGEAICRQLGLRFLAADFKKKGGFEHSLRLSKEHGLYRQDYCGCEFSRRERERRRGQSLR